MATDLDVRAICPYCRVPLEEVSAAEGPEHGSDGIASVRQIHLIPRNTITCYTSLDRRRGCGHCRRHWQAS